MWLITYEHKYDDPGGKETVKKETVETELNPKQYLDELRKHNYYPRGEFYILFAIELKD